MMIALTLTAVLSAVALVAAKAKMDAARVAVRTNRKGTR